MEAYKVPAFMAPGASCRRVPPPAAQRDAAAAVPGCHLDLLACPACRLGHLNSASQQPFDSLQPDVIGSAVHQATAVQVAASGMVLLKNTGVHPLKVSPNSTLAVIGPFADDPVAILG